ncbi:MAG: insulinase family protein [Candidatus Desulfofervidaceae bacterium]|nr:insulinase family protein [Candidatus Desulfofervidaceae bacterium]
MTPAYTQAQLPLEKVINFKLPSGLEVVLQESDTAPVVAIQIWVKTGSAYESETEAGISHLIEHMVFKGTQHYKPGEIAKIIEGNGGSINAYTSFDYTVYHVVMPASKWQVGLNVLADMVQNALFDPQELASEKKVVLEEISKDEDSPFHILSNTLFSTAYKVYPYRRPIIGYTKTVRTFSREDVFRYYKKWYQPANMVAVIVGDIKKEEVKDALNQLFPVSDTVSVFNPPQEPPQKELRFVTLNKPFKETYLGLGFPIPGVGKEDTYALDVLSEILGGSESARLNVILKLKKSIVHSIGTHAFTPKGPGLFIIQSLLEVKNLKTALKEIFTQIEKIKNEGVLSEELAKAKLNLESEFIYDQETMEGWGRTLGFFQVVEGDARRCEDYLANIRAVTEEKVKEVARKYFNPKHLSLVVVAPEEAQVKLTAKEIQSLWPSLLETKPPTRNPSVQKFVLDNGLTLLVKENHHLPTFAVTAVFMGGLRAETPKTNGVSNFVARMLTRGTSKHSAIEIATIIDSMAGQIDTFSGWNTFGLNGHFLTRFFPEAMQLVAEILREPAFAPEEMEKIRTLILAAIKQKEDRPSSLAFTQFYKTLYGNHPYGMDILGTEETIKKITSDDLKRFYHTYAKPNNMVLAVVGRVNANEILKTVKRLFGDWPKQEITFSQPPLPTAPNVPVSTKKILPKEQVHFVLGSLGTTMYAKDKLALAVLDAILSGQGGRLFINLRDKKGLAYALTFVHREGIEPGMWAVYMATSPQKLNEAIEGVKEELRKIIKDGISKAELNRAKEYVLGNFVIGLQTNGQQAMSMALNELYGLGYNYDEVYQEKIKKVTTQDIIKAIRTYLAQEGYVLSLVGPVE